MALTNALAGHAGKQPSAPFIALPVDVDFDTSYPTGGEDFDPQALLKSLGSYDKDAVLLGVFPENKNGHTIEYVDDVVPANRKLKVFTASATEFGNGVDAAAALGTVRVLILAR